MFRIQCRTFLAAGLAGWLTSAASADPNVAPVIKDDGKFFSDKARAEADKKIREIYGDYGRDFLVETFAEAPDDKAKDVDFKDRTARNRFFKEWARKRMEDTKVNGIYLLICKSPEHLQLEVHTPD